MQTGFNLETRFYQGKDWRFETRDWYGGRIAMIGNSDRSTLYFLDFPSRSYTAGPIQRNQRRASLIPVPESGKTLVVYLETVDTGERRPMFGYLARHIIQRVRRVPEPGACSIANPTPETFDGWYIDLPMLGRNTPLNLSSEGCPDMRFDHVELRSTGPREWGFAVRLQQRTTWNGQPQQWLIERVTELESVSLPQDVFLPPADFRLVRSLPNGSRFDNLATGLQRFNLAWTYMTATVEEWLH